MPIEEYKEIAESTTNDDIDKLAELLVRVLAIYKSKRGTYVRSYWKVINERKIESSIACINNLLDYYYTYDSLTPGQIELARKMIKNGFQLI